MNSSNMKHRILIIDFIFLIFAWALPPFFYKEHLTQYPHFFLILFPAVIQIFCFSILGHYDEHLGARLMSRRRIFLNAIVSFVITFFVYKFFSLAIYSSFFIRVRYYFLFFFPFQIFIYSMLFFLSLRKSNLIKAQNICVLGGRTDLERMKNWFDEFKIDNQEFVIKTLIDTNEGQLTKIENNEISTINKSTKLFEILKKHDLVVYFTTQILDTREARNLLRFGSESGSFFDFGTFCGLTRETYPVDAIDTEWYVRKSTNLWLKISLYLRFRSIFDFLASILLLIFTFPLWIFAILGIAFTSPGPIFYTQERIGRLGIKFKIIKFRTMTVDAEKSGPQMASTGDARVTGIGRFLRRSRIDELPQIINVLKGEMSLIGPRPEREHFEMMLNKDLPLLQLRNFIAPGITGLAQVNSDYANDVKSYKRKLGHDLYYILNLSPFLDLSILLRTVRTVLFKKGS
ncbi:MAG: exopolysaccharide biosynthesis polyprenyl glycosylphosphotransferase [Bacteriovoracaceae bacterium]